MLKTIARCAAVAAVIPLAANADVTTNVWQGADGAAWGTPANGCFYVDYRNAGASGTVDFTLTGSGRISGAGIDVHCVRTNRRLVLDSGVTLNLATSGGNKTFMLYNGMVVKSGATNLVDILSLHWNGSYVDLQGGCLWRTQSLARRLFRIQPGRRV